jgi:hypothetical protein
MNKMKRVLDFAGSGCGSCNCWAVGSSDGVAHILMSCPS